MTLFKNPGQDCIASFNRIFSQAHTACRADRLQHEPHFVRHLISNPTISALNNACKSLYDSGRNTVRFRGAFLHHSPFASFNAGGKVFCRRELADAMFVVYETAPGVDGIHTIVRRSACMLMFKKSASPIPSTFNFNPDAGIPPVGSDQEQFYLFNRWPSFELQTGRRKAPNKLGTFDIASSIAAKGATLHDVGKYAVVWHSSAGTTSPWLAGSNQVHWLAGEPTPGFAMRPSDTSLGKLLNDFIDGAQNAGRDFSPRAPSAGDWNGLMGTLLGYPAAGPVFPNTTLPSIDSLLKNATWANQLRDVNPVTVGLMTDYGAVGVNFLECVDAARFTFEQNARELIKPEAISQFYSNVFQNFPSSRLLDLPRLKHPATPPVDEDDATPFPVLIATVARFVPHERCDDIEPLDAKIRWKALHWAANQLL